MIKIHATKKLMTKLPVDGEGFLPEVKNQQAFPKNSKESQLSGWHANLITLQCRNCIIFVHDTTRFPLFIPCLTKLDYANLNWHFQDSLMNTLLKLDANQQQLDTAAEHLTQLNFDSICDRSVQGTMNRMKSDIDHLLWHDNIDIAQLSGYRTGVWLSDRPCNIKGQKDYIWPQKKILSLLDSLSTSEANHKQKADNVIIMEDYRNG